jgi:hypothetical protein
MAGDVSAIIMWEWIHVYPHIPAQEVQAVLALATHPEPCEPDNNFDNNPDGQGYKTVESVALTQGFLVG